MWETVRVVQAAKPKYVVWENVKNLLSKKHRHNFDSYLEIMNDMGYNSYFQVINAKDYGVPQNRERVYTVSIRKDIDDQKFEFPNKQGLKIRLKDTLEAEVDEKYYLSEKHLKNLVLNRNWNCNPSGKGQNGQVCTDDISPTITANKGEGLKIVASIEGPGFRREPKIIQYNIKQKVRVRKYNVDTENLKLTLKKHKKQKELSNNDIALKLDVSVAKVEHWFRTDNCFAIPDENIWFELKKLLNIDTDKFDKAITEFEEKHGVFEKANRIYDVQGIAPTLTQQEEKIIEYPYSVTERFYKQAIETYMENDCVDGDTINAFNKTINKSGISPTITTRPERF